VASILTPFGQGGIAILHVAGPRAFELLREVFRPKAGAVEPDAARLHYGHIVDGDEVVDEVLVRVVPAEQAPGGEPVAEVNCHGGLVAVQRVLECFTRRGAEAIAPEAFVQGQAASAVEAEAVAALQEAGTPLGAEVLLDQLNGALERALREMPWDCPAEAAAALRGLLATERLGRALWQPLTVALVGPVNAGKSALFNALAREDRMIVSPTPGTTRDAVSALVAVGGLPVLLTDTAGEREPRSEVERAAIARARAAAAEADLVLLVLDASPSGIPGSRFQIPDFTRHAARGTRQSLAVLNKSDLGLAPWARQAADAVTVSALTGEGLGRLCDEIVRRAVGEAGYVPGRPVVFTERQGALLREALEAIEAGRREEARRCVEEAIGQAPSLTSPPGARR